MKLTSKIMLAVVMVFSVAMCNAASPTTTLLKTRASYTAAVTTGKWQSNFYKAKKYATDNGLPFIAVWSNGDACGHCIMFENGCNTSYFKDWMASSGMVFYFTYYGDKGDGTTTKSGKKADDGSEGSNIFHWIRDNKNTGYPFVRIYWPKGKVDIATIGDTVDGNKDNTAGAKKSVAYFKSKLKNFKPVTPVVVPKYTGGIFAVGDKDGDRLEAEIGTTVSVDVSLMRSNSVASTISTNTLVVTYPGNVANPETNRIDWAAGDAELANSVAIPAGMTTPGGQIELLLLDAVGKSVATSHITMVAAPENSPLNPLWIGEKMEDELAWGEWTMDLDVATNKVNAYNAGTSETTSGKGKGLLGSPASPKDRAYTLVLLAGSLWCPDCKKTDEFLVMQQKFKDWAQENKVACVALDLPSADDPASTAPCLLTDDPGLSYYRMATVSGASYLSRKMIGKDEAADALARNWEIAQKLRLSNASKKYRPPVPSFFVFRNDGTVAGRIEYFGKESPTSTANIDAYIERLDELLRQVDDPEEEANDNATWTRESVGPRTNVVDKTVSFADEADVYWLDQEAVNKRMAFSLEGTEDVSLQLKVISGGEVVAQATGKVSDGVSVGAKIKSSNYYVSVGYEKDANGKAQDPRFAVTNTASTLCTYTLKTDFAVEPTELADDNRFAVEAGKGVMVNLVSNQLYRITLLDESNAGNLEALVPTNGQGIADGLYLSKVDGDVSLAFTSGEAEIQKWNPGKVGFAVTGATVMESSVLYILRVVRDGGASGRAAAVLSLNADKSSEYWNSLVSLPGDFGDEIAWEEGESGAKTLRVLVLENTFADGDQSIYFDAAATGVASIGIGQFRLLLRDDDKKVPGKIAITDTMPTMAKDMTTFARAGTNVWIALSRVDGTSGEQEVSLVASDDKLNLDPKEFSWPNRIADAQAATLELPSVPGKVKVTMTPKKGSSVDGKRRILTVNVLDSDVPGFKTPLTAFLGNVYIPIDDTEIFLDDYATGSTKVKKYSGSLPPGVKWVFDSDAKKIVISGTPTKAGTYNAVFRASTGSKDGLTTAVAIHVFDPVKTGGGEDGMSPLNGSVAVTRTFADVPVFDVTTNRLAGVFTLTLPRSGRASAKYRGVDSGSISLSCPSWSAIDDYDGTLTAVLTGKTAAGTPCSMTVRAFADGTVDVDFKDPAAPDNDFSILLPGVIWSKKSPATDFKGYYTVSLPVKSAVSGEVRAFGAGYATLKMKTATAINAGKFTYAGILPDGRAFSGSAVATPDDPRTTAGGKDYWARAIVPVVSTGSLNEFSGAFQLTPGAYDSSATNMVDSGLCAGRCYYRTIRRSVAPADEAYLYWRHIEKAPEACYEALLDAYGTYYVETENFASCCQTAFQNTSLKFFVQDEGEGDSQAWPTNGAPVVSVTYTSKTKKNAIKAGTNKRGLTLSFAPATGIVSGTFTLDGEKMTYKGIVLPGWGSDECTACGFSEEKAGGVETQLRPFISGAAWFNDDIEYNDKTISVRTGCPFSIGTQTGK